MFLKTILSKINFELGRNPRILKSKKHHNFIPKNFKAVVLIQADFELAWAWRYTKSDPNPLKKAEEKSIQARKNIPKILELADTYSIPITWATVGHLFLENCDKVSGIPHPEMIRPEKFENTFWNFSGDDWYEFDPCTNYKLDPYWYAPDLIHKILKAKPEQEIACHTFSHIDSSKENCTPELMESELKMCIDLAQKKGITLETFVSPGNFTGNIETIAQMRFKSVRSNNGNILGFPIKLKEGLWDLQSTLGMRLREDWSIKYHIYRYKKIINKAIKKNRVCLFWFHPSIESKFIDQIMPVLFKYLDEKRSQIYISTTKDYIRWLNKNNSL